MTSLRSTRPSWRRRTTALRAVLALIALALPLAVAGGVGVGTASAAVTDTFTGSASGTAPTNWKLHSFTVPADGYRTVTLSWDDPTTDLNLGLRNSAGVVVQWATAAGPGPETVARVLPAGTWTALVSGKSGPLTPYTVTVDDTPLPTCAATFCGTAGLPGASWRTHTIPVTAGEPVQVTLDWADAATVLQLGYQAAPGAWTGLGRAGKPQVATFTPTTSGSYSLAVSAKSGAVTPYTITVLRGDAVPPPQPPAGAVGAYVSNFGFGPRSSGHAGVYAYGMEWDASSGTVLVGDIWNHRILRYTATGERITSFAITGAGDRGTIEPFDVETGPDGTIYSTSEARSRIDVWSPDGTYLRSIGFNGTAGSNGGRGCGGGAVTWPSHLAVTGGKLYASDGFCHDIYVFDATTGAYLSAFGLKPATFGVAQLTPRGLEADADGNLVFVDHASRRLAKFAPDGTMLPGWPTAPEPTMMDPRGLSVDLTTGDIYVAAALQNQLYRFSSTGALLLRLSAPVGGSFNTIRYVSATNGDVYVGDTWGHRIWRLTPNGTQLPWSEPAQPAPNGGFNQVSGIAVDPGSGRLFANDTYENRIQGFATRTATGALSRCMTAADCPAWLSSFGYRAVNSATSDGLNYPRALAAAGGFVFSDAGTSLVRYDIDGRFLNRWGTWGKGPGQFIDGPRGMDVVPTSATTGKVYTVDNGNCRIMVSDYLGNLLDQMGTCGTGVDQMKGPWQIDVAGDLAYVAEGGRSQIAVWDLTTRHEVRQIRGVVAGLALNQPRGVSVDPSGTWVYIADTGNRRVVRVNIATGVGQLVSSGVDNPERAFNYPRSLAFDPQGTLYVSDFNQRIYAYRMAG